MSIKSKLRLALGKDYHVKNVSEDEAFITVEKLSNDNFLDWFSNGSTYVINCCSSNSTIKHLDYIQFTEISIDKIVDLVLLYL